MQQPTEKSLKDYLCLVASSHCKNDLGNIKIRKLLKEHPPPLCHTCKVLCLVHSFTTLLLYEITKYNLILDVHCFLRPVYILYTSYNMWILSKGLSLICQQLKHLWPGSSSLISRNGTWSLDHLLELLITCFKPWSYDWLLQECWSLDSILISVTSASIGNT